MKPIQTTALDKLLAIIPDHPSVRIGHFSNETCGCEAHIAAFCVKRGYEYRINALDKTYAQTLQSNLAQIPCATVQMFHLQRPVYTLQGKLYDFLFVTAPIDAPIRSDFLRKCHPAIKNGGNIIFFLPKSDFALRDSWTMLLEEHYYVATNTIDDLFEHYDIVISRKMHGWGG